MSVDVPQWMNQRHDPFGVKFIGLMTHSLCAFVDGCCAYFIDASQKQMLDGDSLWL